MNSNVGAADRQHGRGHGSGRRTRRARRCAGRARRSGTNLSATKPSLGNRGANARHAYQACGHLPVAGNHTIAIIHPPPGLAHLPTQFAARSSHRTPFASAAELKSTPVPMRLIAKKRCRVMVEPPEKEPVICSSCLPRSPRGQQDAENDSGDPSNFDVGSHQCLRLFLTAVDRRRCEWLTAQLAPPTGRTIDARMTR